MLPPQAESQAVATASETAKTCQITSLKLKLRIRMRICQATANAHQHKFSELSANGWGAKEVIRRKIGSGKNPRVIVSNIAAKQHIRTQKAGNRKGRQEGKWNKKTGEIRRAHPVHHNIRYFSRTGLCGA